MKKAADSLRDVYEALVDHAAKGDVRVPGAPIDDNTCERVLKRAILHRENAIFYKTPRGAEVGDIFPSLIHTTELAGGNPFDDLATPLDHRAEIANDPGDWLPWNHQATLQNQSPGTR